MQSEVSVLFYVDDDRDDLEFFELAANNLGERVILFNMADEVLETLKSPPSVPSIVFLDLNMPNKNGFDLLQEIKQMELFSNLPLVVYSTATDSQTVERCRLLGASLYIRKPTSLAGLQQILRHVLAVDFKTFKADSKTFLL